MSSTATLKLKRATIAGNLLCNIAAKRVEKRCCAFYHPRIKPVLQQIRLLQVELTLTFDWIKFRGSHPIHRRVTSLVAKQVCLGPLKRATCTDFVTKSRTSLYFLQQLSITFHDGFDAWVVKRATPLLNSFCSNIAKQVTCFFCSFYRTFRGGFIEVLPLLRSKISQAKQATKFCTSSWLVLACQQTLFFLYS